MFQILEPVKGKGWFWFFGIALIILATALYSKNLAIQEETKAVKRAERIIETFTNELPGRWHGKVGNSPATLFITKENNQLSGKIVYDGVEEDLSIRFGRNNKDNIVLILKGAGYNRLRGKGYFNLDTFHGIISPDDRSINGSYKDTSGKNGNWSVIKCVSHPVNISGEWEGEWRMGDNWLLNPLGTNQLSFNLSIEQKDSNFVGIIRYLRKEGTSNVKGEICENQISFEYQYSDGTVREYIGVVDSRGKNAQGSWIHPNGSGPWEIAKKSHL